MIENLAIILLAFLGQLGIVSDDHNGPELLTQFIKFEYVDQKTVSQKSNWEYYNENSRFENRLHPLPYKIGNDEIDIDSKSAVAFDAEIDFVLYEKRLKDKMPIASLTKIMTALIVLENNKLDDIVTISENAFKTEGKKEGLGVGEKIKLDDLFKIMLISSNNIAANALAEHTSGNTNDFITLMNKKAEDLGLKDTVFYNSTGLDQENINVSSAYDIAQLADYSLDKPLIWEYSKIKSATLNSVDGKITHRITNTNLLVGKLDSIIGGKTGFTDEAGECLVLIAENPQKMSRVITVVLNANDRFLQTEKLLNWAYKNYKW
jgi:serine-type D-Ala-D-Ala carboxypeptidase (penicillin-binding protein 5/6)